MDTYSNLNPWQKVQVARHPDRPQFQDVIEYLIDGYLSTGFWIVFVAVLLIELNAIFGKMFPVITSVRSVITSSLLLTVVSSGLVFYF